MVVHVGSRGGPSVCGRCHMDASAGGEWVSRGGPSVATVILMVVHVGSGGYIYRGGPSVATVIWMV